MSGKNKVYITISFVLLIIVVAFALVFFETKENKIIENYTREHLSETASLYALTFDEKINDQISILESQARYFSDVDFSDYRKMKEAIIKTKGVENFKRISISDITGMSINYDNKTSGNLSNKEYFKKAISERSPQVSDEIYLDEDKQCVLGLGVPVIQKINNSPTEDSTENPDNDSVVGVVTGTIPDQLLLKIFKNSTFNNDSYSFVISSKNEIIVSHQNLQNNDKNKKKFLNVLDENYKFTDEQKDIFENHINKKEPNLYVYQINGNDYTCIYAPLSINGWIYANIVPYNVIKDNQKKVTASVYVILLIIVLVFIVFTYFLETLIKTTDDVEKDNERLKIANSQAQSLVFEVNKQKKEITFTGDTDFILNSHEHVFPIDYLYTDFLSRIHEDDRSAIVGLKDFVTQTAETFSNEIRFKCADDQYYWFKISGTKIEKANSVKLIGNFINVNTQVIHEQELKTIAETDMLSGLLNKSFTERKIERYINTIAADSVCALFVVDLDNFKKTNDTLGHSMGDIAIRDAAKKISLIFSEKDIIGRFGGDEFCIFMCFKNTIELDHAKRIISEKATSLCSILNEDYFDDTNSVTISASIGVSMYPSDGKNFKELFKKADSALYFIKQNGKNNFKIYTDDLPELGELIYE